MKCNSGAHKCANKIKMDQGESERHCAKSHGCVFRDESIPLACFFFDTQLSLLRIFSRSAITVRLRGGNGGISYRCIYYQYSHSNRMNLKMRTKIRRLVPCHLQASIVIRVASCRILRDLPGSRCRCYMVLTAWADQKIATDRCSQSLTLTSITRY